MVNIDDRVGKELKIDVAAVEDKIHQALLTAIDNVVLSRDQMAEKSNTASLDLDQTL